MRGEQLSCVIIDKLPFAVPTDPIVAARQRFIEENEGSSFFEYSIPQAVIALKQGLGRPRVDLDVHPLLREQAGGSTVPASTVQADLLGHAYLALTE